MGDLFVVTLKVKHNQAWNYVAVDDPLPAVLEAVNPSFASQAGYRVNLEQPSSGWKVDYKELRDDRALFFCDTNSGVQATFRSSI